MNDSKFKRIVRKGFDEASAGYDKPAREKGSCYYFFQKKVAATILEKGSCYYFNYFKKSSHLRDVKSGSSFGVDVLFCR
jgi:hypothetical protein